MRCFKAWLAARGACQQHSAHEETSSKDPGSNPTDVLHQRRRSRLQCARNERVTSKERLTDFGGSQMTAPAYIMHGRQEVNHFAYFTPSIATDSDY